MDSIKDSINQLTEHFTTRMTEFQKELKGAIPATSPTSNIASQFSSLRSFVLSALENLQLQVELLSRQYDELEMRSRNKMLLLHGVREENNENLSTSVTSLLAAHLKIPQISCEVVSSCHRLGRCVPDKSRAVLIKFKDRSLRDKVWSSKTSFKSTGLTVSEFLTKSRHNTFIVALQVFGITNCWTRKGIILVKCPDGTRHRITSMSELKAISTPVQDVPVHLTAPVVSGPSKDKTIVTRAKRTQKK